MSLVGKGRRRQRVVRETVLMMGTYVLGVFDQVHGGEELSEEMIERVCGRLAEMYGKVQVSEEIENEELTLDEEDEDLDSA